MYLLFLSFIWFYRESLVFVVEFVVGSLVNYLEKFDRLCLEFFNIVSVNFLDELRFWRVEEFDMKLLYVCIECFFMFYW